MIARHLSLCGLLLSLAGCAPYPHNHYYSEHHYQGYYGGYPYAAAPSVQHYYYYDADPYYYWNRWYGYPWYYYDRHHDHDYDDDDDHHPRPPSDQERVEALLAHRSDPAEVPRDTLDRHRDDLEALSINRADDRPTALNRRLDTRKPTSLRRSSGSFSKPTAAPIQRPAKSYQRSHWRR